MARQTNFHLRFGFRHKAKGRSQHTRNLLRSIGLDEVIKRMDGKRIERIFTRCGQKHNQASCAALAHVARGFDAVHAVHADIQKDKRIVARRKAVQKGFAAVEAGNRRVQTDRHMLRKVVLQRVAIRLLVIDNRDADIH